MFIVKMQADRTRALVYGIVHALVLGIPAICCALIPYILVRGCARRQVQLLAEDRWMLPIVVSAAIVLCIIMGYV